MKIVATIKDRHDINLMSKIMDLKKLGIKDFRFNYAKINSEKDEEKFFKIINDITNQYYDINIIIDVPYPGRKNRSMLGRIE